MPQRPQNNFWTRGIVNSMRVNLVHSPFLRGQALWVTEKNALASVEVYSRLYWELDTAEDPAMIFCDFSKFSSQRGVSIVVGD